MKGQTPALPQRSPPPGLSAPASLVFRHDHDRFVTALFASLAERERLFALYAFNYEVARVREAVSEPLLGRIRLQWWRETIAAIFAGEPVRRHEVALPLAAAIRDGSLSRESFDQLIDAREFDLEPDPPATFGDLESYAAGTSSTLVRLALEALGARDPAAQEAGREVGIAYSLAGLLRALPFHATVGRCYLPADIVRRAGLDSRDYAERRPTEPLRAVVQEIAAAALSHLDRARQHRPAIGRQAMPALLPGVIADRWLVRLRRNRYDPFDPALAIPDPTQSWRLAAGMLLRRF